MLRVVGLALLLGVGAAVPAAANDRHGGANSAPAAHHGPTTRGAGPLVLEPTRPLQLARALTTAPSALPGTLPAAVRRTPATPTAVPATRTPERRENGRWLALPWLTAGKSSLRLPVTERLSFGVGYRHLEGEDLWHRHAEAGSVDYDSHDFLLRAHWRF